MKQDEKNNAQLNEQQEVENAKKAEVENLEAVDEKEEGKKGIGATPFVAAGAAVAGGAVLGSATAEQAPEDVIVTPGEPLADAGVINQPHISEPIEAPVVDVEDTSDAGEANAQTEGEQTADEEQRETTGQEDNGTNEEVDDIPIVEVDEAGVERIELTELKPQEITSKTEEETFLADNLDVHITPENPEIPVVPGEGTDDSGIDLAYHPKDLTDSDDASDKMFEIKERTVIQEGDTETAAVSIVDEDGQHLLLVDRDGDGVYEAIENTDGELVAYAKGGISESDIDDALDDVVEDGIDDLPISADDVFYYDDDNSVVDDIEDIDVADVDLA